MESPQIQKILFGLKVRQFRQELGWNFEEMSRQTGISISYLNEIEKGKKFPKTENRQKIATALGLSEAFLISPELTKQYAPLGDLLRSNFLSELPLDLFGIEMQQIVEIIARAPDRVNAFISALLEIARVYSLQEENFYFAALRAYQELRSNYFEEIEIEAAAFVAKHHIPDNGGVPYVLLLGLLEKEFGYKVRQKGLAEFPELRSIRSVFVPKKKELLLNDRLTERQLAFQLAKELGFNVLKLKERPFASSFTKSNSFEEVLNNYKAAYFAVAILINSQAFSRDLSEFFSHKEWNGDILLKLMKKYQASPEVLFQRFNILTKDFGLDKVFFLRFIHDLEKDEFEIDKELHLNRRHYPHASGIKEHYCRRWLSPAMLRELQEAQQQNADDLHLLTGVQRASFLNTDEEYLCIAIAKPALPTAHRNIGITLGVLLDEHAKKRIGFWNDPAIPKATVNITCERCSITDCKERAAPPTVNHRKEERKKIQEALDRLTNRK
ncbi:MAG: helix-turn-helix domain-containing protein [Saprospiraceae bacterium]|nr:helix-turn-helix domain-containing protein [Saprospiraceae bacterium]MCB9345772.1 helix-turn-helix domain-containing protein [Lewinellaceae bacterium]